MIALDLECKVRIVRRREEKRTADLEKQQSCCPSKPEDTVLFRSRWVYTSCDDYRHA